MTSVNYLNYVKTSNQKSQKHSVFETEKTRNDSHIKLVPAGVWQFCFQVTQIVDLLFCLLYQSEKNEVT